MYFVTEGDLDELRLLLFCTLDYADGLVLLFAISAAGDSELFCRWSGPVAACNAARELILISMGGSGWLYETISTESAGVLPVCSGGSSVFCWSSDIL